MRVLLPLVLIIAIFSSCKTNKSSTAINTENPIEETQDTIRIANDELEYEIIIIDIGFDSWMIRRARPMEFYTQSFLEARNIQYVTEWNRRVITSGYETDLYEMRINYSLGIDYGMEVNYLLYHYFVFFQERYNQKLTTHFPRF